MTRKLRRGENRIGLEGLALLRLRNAADASTADAIIGEIEVLLATLDDDENRAELRYPVLDASAGYERWARVYDALENPVVAHEGPHMQRILSTSAGEPVLDAACGTGRHLAFLASLDRRVIGVDQSEAMLAEARAKVPSADLRHGELEALPLDEGAVAGAVCSLALDHVADLDAAFRELHRVVEPGGWVAVSVMHPVMRNLLGWSAWFEDDGGRAEVVSHHRNVSDYLNAALHSGLALTAAQEIPLSDATAARMMRPTAPVGPPIALSGLPLILLLRFARR